MRLSSLSLPALTLLFLPLASCNTMSGNAVGSIVQEIYLGDAAVDGFIESADGGTTGSATTDKDVKVGDNNSDEARRGFLRFLVGGIPAGATILSATLEVNHQSAVNAPYDLGPSMFVDHVLLGAALDVTDFAGNTLDAAIGVLSTSPTAGLRSLDVTSQLQADVNAGRSTSDYRLWFPVGTDSDSKYDAARFNAADDSWSNGKTPRLVVQWTP